MFEGGRAERIVQALIAAGLSWPALYGLATAALASPVERALLLAWCGSPPHGAAIDLLGHCLNCWSGAAAFFLAAGLVAAVNRPSFRPAAA